ncbi:kinetochore protein SPC25 homolog isoform X2 [Mangifera indica]|uniref:kinetochore protein SPC25 homolog isoform X2 n=1 Tax=Mangifera indica TaxID=29780 RepID=UPI001CFBFB87|nr:kinetochore protein SPC25 homolog isoform X2 [Mangifera indica]
MQIEVEDSVRTKMESLRLICDREIPFNQQKMDSFVESFRHSLESVKAKALETIQNQAKLAKVKAELRDAEDEYVKVLAVKTRKEVKQMTTRDSISATKVRLEELKKTVEAQRARRDEYAAIISQQSQGLAISEGKTNQDTEWNEEIQEAILWYNRVLGFHVEGGPGVKFTFNNIDINNPNEQYSFTIRHTNDNYTLLDCDPPLNNIKELIQELNRTNGLFRFVRIMRERFQEAAALGFRPQSTTLHQDSSTISGSAPVFSVSTNRSGSPAKKNEYQIECGESNRQENQIIHQSEPLTEKNEQLIQDEGVYRQSKKVNRGRGAIPALLSPGSAASLRRSPRFKVKN